MSDKKEKTYNTDMKKDSDNREQSNDPMSGYGKTGGNMGAGKSGAEGLGTEKTSDDARMGSRKSSPDSDKKRADDTGARQENDRAQ